MTKRPSLTDEQKELIADMRERGLSCGVISRRLNLSQGAVSWHCLVAGIDSPRTRSRVPAPVKHDQYMRNGRVVLAFSPDDDAQLLALEAEGKRYGTIAKIMGRRRNSVLGRLATLARHEARREASAS